MVKSKKIDFGREAANVVPMIYREFMKRSRQICAKGNIALPHIAILDLLRVKGACKMSHIAGVLDLSMSAATIIVDKMIATKLVRRERSPEDRRVVKVSLQRKGKEIAVKLDGERKRLVNDLFSALTESEKREYMRLLRKVSESLKNGTE